jgi:hypothetical protein
VITYFTDDSLAGTRMDALSRYAEGCVRGIKRTDKSNRFIQTLFRAIFCRKLIETMGYVEDERQVKPLRWTRVRWKHVKYE